jgi:hypothetical protein
MIRAGCILQARHILPESPYDDNEPLDSPQALQRLKERSDEVDEARIVTIDISEAQARTIIGRLWPREGLLGATCGRGFLIESEDQASVVNEILAPDVHINFNLKKHKWMIQTWPEDSE